MGTSAEACAPLILRRGQGPSRRMQGQNKPNPGRARVAARSPHVCCDSTPSFIPPLDGQVWERPAFQRAIARTRRSTYIESGTISRRTVLETPCVNICLLDAATGLCAGCGRTMEGSPAGQR